MNKSEKKRLRERIGEKLDVSRARTTDDEAMFLDSFLNTYVSDYQGRTKTVKNRGKGFSSDGKYWYEEITNYTFMEEPGIQVDYSYHDDDGGHQNSTRTIRDARGILDFFKNHPDIKH